MTPVAAKRSRLRLCLCLSPLLLLWVLPVAMRASSAPGPAAEAQQAERVPNDIQEYISSGWDALTRSMTSCASLVDPKTHEEPTLYLPKDMPAPAAVAELQQKCRVRVERLPSTVTEPGGIDLDKIPREGLLYLEHPYVVPGGQFNEMYGWDSYFIIRGLLRDGREALAKGMVENFFFEIEHYGGVLNANRTYYLTRSQPPFLSSMILAIFDYQKAQGRTDLEWLARAYGYAERDYRQWNEGVHLAGDTGLARYFDRGEGPAPEILSDPSHYYRGVAQYFLTHPDSARYLADAGAQAPAAQLVGPVFSLFVCDPNAPRHGEADCAPPAGVALSADFYKGDRSLRESGFDVTFRFGPYGDETHHYAPVCLNSLLYKTEKDLEEMSLLLGHPEDAANWRRKAEDRRARIVKYLWDAGDGLFYDYQFVNKQQSRYAYATTFYPLWAGLASPDQARAVAQNLRRFEQPGGLATSQTESGAQWDFPYGWAPLELLAAEGLRRYGYTEEADRISSEFVSTVFDNFEQDHTIREKYNVVTRSDETSISKGYTQNVIGFGWTNGVFLELLHESPAAQAALRKHRE